MNLQRKLAAAFAVLAVLLLGVSLFASWQVDRLSAALYEVGVIRLPSIQGLVMMSDGIGVVDDAAERLANAADLNSQKQQEDRIKSAWDRFDRGWKMYEPLPQTAEEAKEWRGFMPVATAWRQGYAAALAELRAAVIAHDATRRTEAQGRMVALAGTLAETQSRLQQLTALNYEVAETAKRGSIASYNDVARLRGLMLALSIAAAIVALGFGLAVGRRISEPIAEIGDVIHRVANGERSLRLPIRSNDELGDVARALNEMVGALGASETQLRVLGDNLPGCMIFQLEFDAEGRPHFLYVSAGAERLHGLSAKRLLQDASRFYAQIFPEDHQELLKARETTRQNLTVFHAQYRIRRADGAVRTMTVWSKPRREASGRTIWDGIEIDVSQTREAEAQRERLARAIDVHYDAAYWMDASWRIVYVNEAACRAVGYTRDELIGQPVSLISPNATPERLQQVWAELRSGRSFKTETVHRRKDGSEFPVELVSTFIRFQNEEMTCGFARDITDRRKAHADLERQVDELKRWHRLTLDREDRVAELKAEVNQLCLERGQPPRYPSQIQRAARPSAVNP